MLQQTQVSRVVAKYPQFIRQFPNPAALAAAPLRRALEAWAGLGYNRRCLHLRAAAGQICRRFAGRVPGNVADLRTLPGVGPYIASAVAVFAFGTPVPMIETNIRRVFLHWFFPGESGVSDARIRPVVEQTMDRRDPASWFNALMDYGAWLAAQVPNPNRRSRHYARQRPFEGSVRQLRGRILAAIVGHGTADRATIGRRTGASGARLSLALDALEREGFLRRRGSRYGPA